LHGYLLGHDVKDKADRQRAIERYVALVAAGQGGSQGQVLPFAKKPKIGGCPDH
jgi:hypothetical protein